MTLQTVSGFAHLFYGRNDAWFDGDNNRCIRRPVTLQHFRRHLSGEQSIGTYPVLDNKTCRWGCIDLDSEHDDFQKALNVWAIWNYYNIPAWLERSRSKGWHVWVFTDEWVPAEHMRNAGLAVVELAELGKVEVNPKNDDPAKTPNGLVNTVRLPYAGNAKRGRMVFVDPHTAQNISVESFVRQATERMVNGTRLQSIAENWTGLQREKRIRQSIPGSLRTLGNVDVGDKSNQVAVEILAGRRFATIGERDNQLYTIAKYLKGRDVPYGDALAEMEKVHERALEDPSTYPLEQALEKITRVYGM